MNMYQYSLDKSFISAEGYSNYRLIADKINLLTCLIGMLAGIVILILYFCKKFD
jgi:hypothetical protein